MAEEETESHQPNEIEDEPDIEPKERWSSSDVVAAAEELRFKDTTKTRNQSTKQSKWHLLTIDDIGQQLNSDKTNGLKSTQIESLETQYGLNRITPPPKTHWFRKFCLDCKIWLILISMILSIVISSLYNKEILILIFAILLSLIFCCSLWSAYNKYKKEQELDLSALSRSDAIVIRDEQEKIINSLHIVPGDILVLRAGVKVCADVRIINCTENLQVDESGITGQIEPQIKNANVCDDDTMQSLDAKNMLWSETLIVEGECMGFVVATGDNTLIGKTAQMAVTVVQDNDNKEDNDGLIRLSNKCTKYMWLMVCVLSVICFVILLVMNKNNGISVAGILWFVIGIIIIIIPCLFIFILTWMKSKAISKQLENNIMIKSNDAIYKLGDIGYLIIDEVPIVTKKWDWNDNSERVVVDVVINDITECMKEYDEMDIKVIIITNDTMDNIKSICKQCGYYDDENENEEKKNVAMIDGINDNDIDWREILRKKRIIFTSIDKTKEKVEIIEKLKEGALQINDNKLFASCGSNADDVNLMKVSDLGISYGILGTDVAKEVSDIIVMDDKLESIIKGIKLSKQLKQSCLYKFEVGF